MKIAVFGDNGVGRWYAQLFDELEHVTFYLSDKNKHGLNVTKHDKVVLSNKKETLMSVKNFAHYFNRLIKNNWDRKRDFHYFELREFVKDNAFDIAITKSDRSLYTLSTLKQEFNNFKLIYWIPFVIPFQDLFDKRSFQIREYAFKRVDRFIAITDTCKKTLEFEGIDSRKISHIYPGIDTVFFDRRDKAESKKMFGIQENTINILYVGKLTTWKGVYTLLYMLKILKEKYNNIRLTILGRGAQEEDMKRMSKILEIDDIVVFEGFVSYEKINSFYNAADLFILPSLPSNNIAEQFGFVVAEAMASGVPVIVSKTGGLPEVVGYKEELLFTPGDYCELAQKTNELLRNRALYDELSIFCYERAKKNYSLSINGRLICKELASM